MGELRPHPVRRLRADPAAHPQDDHSVRLLEQLGELCAVPLQGRDRRGRGSRSGGRRGRPARASNRAGGGFPTCRRGRGRRRAGRRGAGARRAGRSARNGRRGGGGRWGAGAAGRRRGRRSRSPGRPVRRGPGCLKRRFRFCSGGLSRRARVTRGAGLSGPGAVPPGGRRTSTSPGWAGSRRRRGPAGTAPRGPARAGARRTAATRPTSSGRRAGAAGRRTASRARRPGGGSSPDPTGRRASAPVRVSRCSRCSPL
ncbi:hypothetical protein RKD21_002544 [Streptomyces albogriseolus]|uniref:Uncharacterized protein n=1 Tax=Streptomyces albogriseolus TaxID=1887 RepID=A0ACC6UL94_STRAO